MKRLATITFSCATTSTAPFGGTLRGLLSIPFLALFLAGNFLQISLAEEEEIPKNEQNWRPSELYFGSYLATDRQKKREIEVAKKLIEGKKYTDGIRLLVQILAAENDSLDSQCKSLKQQAAQILSSLPPAGRRTYATLYENQLKRELGKALKERDKISLAKLAASFPPETWGEEAANDVESFGRNAWQAWSWAEQEFGNYALAAAIEDAINSATSNVNEGYRFYTSFEKRLQIASSKSEKGQLSLDRPAQRWFDRHSPRQWLGAGGGPEKRFTSIGKAPTAWRSWYAATGLKEGPIEVLRRKMPEQAATLPVSNAIAVEGILVVRQENLLIGIDAESGKRQWIVNLTGQLIETKHESFSRSSRDRLPAQIAPLGIEAWLDRVYGTISSDSQSVFAITPSLKQDPSAYELERLGRSSRTRSKIDATNSLASFDLARQGKLRWRLDRGDVSSEVAGARFLGVPTAIGDWLAVLVEQQGMIGFLLLDSGSGKLIWKQPLASHSRSGRTDALNRIGVSPTWHKGRFYCPTGVGVIVSIDPFRRTIDWVTHVPVDPKLLTRGNLSSGRTGLRAADSRLRSGSGWRETRIVAHKDLVVVATSESNRISCFDSTTGTLRWSQAMESGLLLSSIVDLDLANIELSHQVLIIEGKSLAAISLLDGKKLWRIYLTSGDRPAGDGLLLDEEYLLPLQSGRLARVSLQPESKQRVTYLQLGIDPLEKPAKLGNLLVHQGALYARSTDALECYRQPGSINPALAEAESALERREYENAYRRFDTLLEEGVIDRHEGVNRRDATALLAERDKEREIRLPLSSNLASEQRIEPLLYAFLSALRGNDREAASQLGKVLLSRPDRKTKYVAPNSNQIVQVERWIRSQLAAHEYQPHSISIAPDESQAIATDSVVQEISEQAWSTNQVLPTLSLSNEENQEQASVFSRRNLRGGNSIPQRLGVRGTSSWINQWEVYNTGGERPDLVGRNNFGEIAFSEQLPAAIEGTLRASVIGEAASCCWMNHLIVQLGESIAVYDLSYNEYADRLLWSSLQLEEDLLYPLPLYESSEELKENSKSSLRNRGGQGEKVYCFDAWGAIVMRDGKISCIDPVTGTLFWSVSQWKSYDRVFSLEDRIYFGRTSSRKGVVLSKQDGKLLGEWNVPNGDWRHYSNGKLFVTTRGEAKLFDITDNNGLPIWTTSLKEKQYSIYEDSLLLLDNDGKLTCIELADGQTCFQTKLVLAEGKTPFMQAQVIQGQLLLGLSYESTSGHRQKGVTPLGEKPIITGQLYNLDPQTGRSNWVHPVTVEGVGILQEGLDSSDLLYLAGRKQDVQSNNGSSLNHLLIIDLASGRTLYRSDQLPASRQGRLAFEVLEETPSIGPRFDEPENRVLKQQLVQLGTVQIRLQLIDQPSPPSPPALAAIERPHREEVNFNEFGEGITRWFDKITQPTEGGDGK